MKLNEKNKKDIIDFLDVKWPQPRICDICHEKDSWTIPDVLFELREFRSGSKSAPIVVLVCNNCGSTKLFNAIITGIVKKHECD